MKNDIMDKNVYDVNFVRYLIDDWIRNMTVQVHIRHMKVIKSIDGTTITLQIISPEIMPDIDNKKTG